MNYADPIGEFFLPEAGDPTGPQYQIGNAGVDSSRVVAKEGENGGPKGHNRLTLVSLPAFVNFAHDAELGSDLLLSQAQNQAAIPERFAQFCAISSISNCLMKPGRKNRKKAKNKDTYFE